MLVDVRHEDAADLRLRKGIRLIDGTVGGSMPMIGDGLDVAVVWIEVPAALAHVDAAGNHVEQMWNDAGADQQLALRVVVDPPGIAETWATTTSTRRGRVIAPRRR